MSLESRQQKRNVKWVEGLRGITSALVIVTHIARAFDYPLFFPKDTAESPGPRLLQLPILRVPFQGRIGVPIFAFLTGFVCAYKPLQLAYHKHDGAGALQAIARSAFRRPPRLILPATIMTAIAATLTYLGAFRAADRCDRHWVRFDAPTEQGGIGLELRQLFRNILTTWAISENTYDRHQWAMRPLLIGAFQVYLMLAATMGMRFRYRMLVHVLFMSYWWANWTPLTETFGANIQLGTILAELSLHRPTQNFLAGRSRLLALVVAPLLILTGLYIGSYPQEHWEWAGWSQCLQHWFVGGVLIPNGSDINRRFSTIGMQMCAVAIFLSAPLRELLSHRLLLWLGAHSFAVYLVHGSILRTVGIWIVYGIRGEPWTPAGTNPDGSPQPQEWLKPAGRGYKVLAILVFIVLTYTAAWAWMRWVDAACARFTQWLESRVFKPDDDQRDEEAEKGLLRLGSGGVTVEPSDLVGASPDTMQQGQGSPHLYSHRHMRSSSGQRLLGDIQGPPIRPP